MFLYLLTSLMYPHTINPKPIRSQTKFLSINKVVKSCELKQRPLVTARVGLCSSEAGGEIAQLTVRLCSSNSWEPAPDGLAGLVSLNREGASRVGIHPNTGGGGCE